eukprot:jgi/Chlat1/5804/Chrsp4S06170
MSMGGEGNDDEPDWMKEFQPVTSTAPNPPTPSDDDESVPTPKASTPPQSDSDGVIDLCNSTEPKPRRKSDSKAKQKGFNTSKAAKGGETGKLRALFHKAAERATLRAKERSPLKKSPLKKSPLTKRKTLSLSPSKANVASTSKSAFYDLPDETKPETSPKRRQIHEQAACNDDGGFVDLANNEDEHKGAGAVPGKVGPEEDDHDNHNEEKALPEKARQKASRCSLSSMPLFLSEKLSRAKVLVEVDGDSAAADLSGDAGAVGRLRVGNASDPDTLIFDLKGVIYRGDIVPSMALCVVNIGAAEAKIESVTTDFLRLTEQEGLQGGETVVEGNLGAFDLAAGDEETAGVALSQKKRKAEESNARGSDEGNGDEDGKRKKKMKLAKAPAKPKLGALGGATRVKQKTKKAGKPRAKKAPTKPRAASKAANARPKKKAKG